MHHHYGILLILGLSAFVGLAGAYIFQRLKFPQVVGYIIIGLFFGQTGIGLIDEKHIAELKPFTFFALGIIGFLVGGELKLSEFKKYGKQFSLILLGEGLAAFFMVGISSGIVLYFVTNNMTTALAGGIVFGAIASATDPASTIDVLWEYKSKGVLTIAIIAIVALDDALAMSLYSIGKAISTILAGGDASVSEELIKVGIELGGAVLLAVVLGSLLSFLLRKVHDKDKVLTISICTLLLVIGLSVSLGLDVILSSMFLGFLVSNMVPLRSVKLFQMARSMSMPIYVMFFVLVGARLNISVMPSWIWLIIGLYVFFRSLGKFSGSWLGGKLSGAEKSVTNYCGIGLFSQGGVAVGLSIVAGENLQILQITDSFNLGETIVTVVTATTLIVQIIGPPMTKFAISIAKEIGKDITEEDILKRLQLKKAVRKVKTNIFNFDSIYNVVDAFSENSISIQAVLNKYEKVVGIISFESLREALPDQDMWQWLLASDVMSKPVDPVTERQSMWDALNIMDETGKNELLVYDNKQSCVFKGIITREEIKDIARKEFLINTA